MPRWLLAPIDHLAEIRQSYSVQRIVVETPGEREARKQVANAAPGASQPNPWLDRALTFCEGIDEG